MLNQDNTLYKLFVRPQSIAEVANRCEKSKSNYASFFREFLMTFYAFNKDEKLQSVSEEPEPTTPELDAYSAAVVEYLCHKYDLQIPSWTENPERFLHSPWFPCELENLKPMLIMESPPEFRRRFIFVELDPLPKKDLTNQKAKGR